MDKRAGPVVEISLTGMEISPYINTHKRAIARLPGWKFKGTPAQAIFNNCQKNINVTKLSRQAGWNFLI
jgi:hypothetical protein